MTKTRLDPSLRPYVAAALGRKAIAPVVLDVSKVTDVADIFLICSGRSNRQVTAIAEFIEAEMKKAGVRPISIEGVKEGHWALIDYGHVVIHVFYEPVRQFYDLESLWADAEQMDISELTAQAEDPKETEL